MCGTLYTFKRGRKNQLLFLECFLGAPEVLHKSASDAFFFTFLEKKDGPALTSSVSGEGGHFFIIISAIYKGTSNRFPSAPEVSIHV